MRKILNILILFFSITFSFAQITIAEGGASNSTNTDGITGSGSNATVSQYTAKGINIVWEENTNGKYVYDTQKKTNLPADKYPSVKDAEDKVMYQICWCKYN